ncbi:hypothetical protein GOP47_0023083 [Adiantum capillus-veneris]|uniref:Uncharacterized protein n=1 Tax=Adiantum capillus-veneris TaxID=13818 RepID=A0A9D4Z5Y2_ADICA|nr:hypothetical protein GOP47_0023083 [Adiantum capillus-veneris]
MSFMYRKRRKLKEAWRWEATWKAKGEAKKVEEWQEITTLASKITRDLAKIEGFYFPRIPNVKVHACREGEAGLKYPLSLSLSLSLSLFNEGATFGSCKSSNA